MDNIKQNSVRLIVGLCVTAVIAVVGWTTTVNLAAQVRAMQSVREETTELRAVVAANNVRISVLENKYDTIQAALLEIKLLIQKHMEK